MEIKHIHPVYSSDAARRESLADIHRACLMCIQSIHVKALSQKEPRV